MEVQVQRKLSPSEKWRQAAGDIGVARYLLCCASCQAAVEYHVLEQRGAAAIEQWMRLYGLWVFQV